MEYLWSFVGLIYGKKLSLTLLSNLFTSDDAIPLHGSNRSPRKTFLTGVFKVLNLKSSFLKNSYFLFSPLNFLRQRKR